MDTLISGFHTNSIEISTSNDQWEQAMWTHNCCRDVENKLMLGKGPLKLFRDKSNTFKLEDALKIDAGSIGPEKLFILKFLKKNLHFQYIIRSNDLTTFKRRDQVKK